jgi:hypothetical protein
VHDSNTWVDSFGVDLIDGVSLPDTTKLFRISDVTGINSFKFNSRELDAIGKGILDPPGVSLIRANSAQEAMQLWNKVFPTRQVDLSSIRGTTAAEIREAGFDAIHNPSRGKLGDAHARLIHPEGVDGFNDSNLKKLDSKFKCP